jgi:hypothetical protein
MTTLRSVSDLTVSGTALLIHEALARSRQHKAHQHEA